MARRRWWAYARRNRRLLFRVTGILAVTAAVASVPAMLYGPFGRGFVVGSLTTICVAFLVWIVAQESGAVRAKAGAVAEQNTAKLLDRLERGGWRVLNDVFFDKVNVDHVAVGPGGVFAVETKSTSAAWDFTANRLDTFADAALRQARAAARKTRLLLPRRGLRRHTGTGVLGTERRGRARRLGRLRRRGGDGWSAGRRSCHDGLQWRAGLGPLHRGLRRPPHRRVHRAAGPA